MGKPWYRTRAQNTFLETRKAPYLEAGLKGRYEPFLAKLEEDWFSCWPEREALFGKVDIPDSPLTDEQQVQLNEAIETRQGQLMTFMRWHADKCKAASRKASRKPDMLSKLLQPAKRTRRPHLTEVYSAYHFKKRISSVLKAEMLATKPLVETRSAYASRKLNTQRAVTSRLFLAESPEFQDKIKHLRETAPRPPKKKKGANEDGSDSDKSSSDDPESDDDHDEGDVGDQGGPSILKEKGKKSTELSAREMQQNINNLGSTLVCLTSELALRTGWTFTVLMGSMVEDGTMRSASIHHGTTAAGNTFANATVDYNETIMGPWGEFLVRKYSTSMQAEHAQAFNQRRAKRDKVIPSPPEPVKPQAPINAGLLTFQDGPEDYPPVDAIPGEPVALQSDPTCDALSTPVDSSSFTAFLQADWPELFGMPDFQSSPPRHARIQHTMSDLAAPLDMGGVALGYQDLSWGMPPFPMEDLQDRDLSHQLLDNFMSSSSPLTGLQYYNQSPSSNDFSFEHLSNYLPSSYELPNPPLPSLLQTMVASTSPPANPDVLLAPTTPPVPAAWVAPVPALSGALGVPAAAIPSAVGQHLVPPIDPAPVPMPMSPAALRDARSSVTSSAIPHPTSMPTGDLTSQAASKHTSGPLGAKKKTGTGVGKKTAPGKKTGTGEISPAAKIGQPQVTTAMDPNTTGKKRKRASEASTVSELAGSKELESIPIRPKPRPVGKSKKTLNETDINAGDLEQDLLEGQTTQRQSRARKPSGKAGVVLMWEQAEEERMARKKAKTSAK